MSYRRLAKLFLVAYDRFSNRQADGCRKILSETQWLKRSELRQLQFKRLRALLNHAYANTLYYHSAFKNVGFRPSDLRNLDDLAKVPVLTRKTFCGQTQAMKTIGLPTRMTTRWMTSGTTSSPVEFYRGKTDVSWGIGAELRGLAWAGYAVGDKIGVIWSPPHQRARKGRAKLKNMLARTLLLDIADISEKSMESFARKLEEFKPDFIKGYATATNVFANFLLQRGTFNIRPKAVFTSAAMLFPHYRKNIEEAFNCRVYDYYASAEVSHIAAQCGQNQGLHVTEENVLVEIIKDNETSSPGEEGRILVTNLHSYAMPVIRYDIGDLGKMYQRVCSCGRELSLLQPVGRTYQYFINTDGSFTRLRDLQTFFEDIPIKDYQLIQESYDEIVVKLVIKPGFSQSHIDFITNNLKFGGKAIIRVEVVDCIPLEKSGKIRHTVSKISNKYG